LGGGGGRDRGLGGRSAKVGVSRSKLQIQSGVVVVAKLRRVREEIYPPGRPGGFSCPPDVDALNRYKEVQRHSIGSGSGKRLRLRRAVRAVPSIRGPGLAGPPGWARRGPSTSINVARHFCLAESNEAAQRTAQRAVGQEAARGLSGAGSDPESCDWQRSDREPAAQKGGFHRVCAHLVHQRSIFPAYKSREKKRLACWTGANHHRFWDNSRPSGAVVHILCTTY